MKKQNTLDDLINEIHQFHQSITAQSDEELLLFSKTLFSTTKPTKTANALLIKIYALVLEIFKRKRIAIHDTHLKAAIALDQGKLLVLESDEDKNIAVVFPAILNLYNGKKTHIIHADAHQIEKNINRVYSVYNFLNIPISFIKQDMPAIEKKKAYHNQVCYSTAKAIVFDYLNNFIAYEEEEQISIDFDFAIIMDAEVLLIDEARNSLALAGTFIPYEEDFVEIANFVSKLTVAIDYKIDPRSNAVYFTESGGNKIKEHFSNTIFSDNSNPLLVAINLAIKAKELLKRDTHYVVQDDKIKLLDEFTGKIIPDRKYHNALQVALEAKENLPLNSRASLLNSISLHQFFQQYSKLAGIATSIQNEIHEYLDFYHLETIIISPNNESTGQQETKEANLYELRKAFYQFAAFVEIQRKILQEERQKILADPHYYFTAQGKTLSALESQPQLATKIKQVLLQQYDECWSNHLDYLSELRANISTIGKKSLNLFRKKADEHFQSRCDLMDRRIEKRVKRLIANPDLSLEELSFIQAHSTWMYAINDTPFNNSITKNETSFSSPVSFVKNLFQKWKK